ncbi:hypothetical protein P7K49_020369 [Saguinus oedipus]|uniref:Uncharacterized protein n=1 Tax=Saguinus oedipus TaxID=9490 RepID=A0ABQ9V0D4_SAGOE|nr:hypothetical protein P7K49_020369 [Saguinus oedipus]
MMGRLAGRAQGTCPGRQRGASLLHVADLSPVDCVGVYRVAGVTPAWVQGTQTCLQSRVRVSAAARAGVRRPHGRSLLSTLPLPSRHPVKHVSFSSRSLITANVPYQPVVRNADRDSFTPHRRHRGLIRAYEFAVDQLAFQSPLPACRSSCDTTATHYDLALAFPFSHV